MCKARLGGLFAIHKWQAQSIGDMAQTDCSFPAPNLIAAIVVSVAFFICIHFLYPFRKIQQRIARGP